MCPPSHCFRVCLCVCVSVCLALHAAQYARHLESTGDIKGAIEHFEKAKVHRTEVPRLLFDSNIAELEAYVHRSDDKELMKWWAQFCESKGHFEQAVEFYNRAEDALSLVRVYCFNQDFDTATELVLESGDRASAYYLARQQELAGNTKDAMFFFEKVCAALGQVLFSFVGARFTVALMVCVAGGPVQPRCAPGKGSWVRVQPVVGCTRYGGSKSRLIFLFFWVSPSPPQPRHRTCYAGPAGVQTRHAGRGAVL